MTRLTISLALLLPALAVALPTHAPWPGGIAVVPLDQEQRPEVRLDGKPALTVRHEGRWHAVIGIPLGHAESTLTATIGETTQTIPLETRQYREQHLTVKPSYVEPDEASLARIRREQQQIAAAIRHWSDLVPASLTLAAPVPGRRSDSFGSRRFFNGQPRSPHRGMDLSGATGTPIRAPLAGTVILTGDFYFTGNAVFVDHGSGLVTLYAHLDDIAVAEGEAVSAGALLGTVGATGRVTGPHLHFATYLNGTPVDPALLLAAD